MYLQLSKDASVTTAVASTTVSVVSRVDFIVNVEKDIGYERTDARVNVSESPRD